MQASVAVIQKDKDASYPESGKVSFLIQIEPGIKDWLSKLQDERRLNSTLRILMRERMGENTAISHTRCGLCRRFQESNCPINDLYLHPNVLVYPYFAEKCALYEETTQSTSVSQLNHARKSCQSKI